MLDHVVFEAERECTRRLPLLLPHAATATLPGVPAARPPGWCSDPGTPEAARAAGAWESSQCDGGEWPFEPEEPRSIAMIPCVESCRNQNFIVRRSREFAHSNHIGGRTSCSFKITLSTAAHRECLTLSTSGSSRWRSVGKR